MEIELPIEETVTPKGLPIPSKLPAPPMPVRPDPAWKTLGRSF
jgi:hypothetical protein